MPPYQFSVNIIQRFERIIHRPNHCLHLITAAAHLLHPLRNPQTAIGGGFR